MRAIDRTAGQDQRELLAAVPGQQVGGAQALVGLAAQRPEQAIAGLVPVTVVEDLEVVEVDQADRDRAPVAHRAGDLALQMLVPGAAVGQAGEGIRARQALEAAPRTPVMDLERTEDGCEQRHEHE